MTEAGPLSPIPVRLPRTELIYEAVADLGPTMRLGEGPLGERRIVSITGGVFAGPRIRGTILPGGADRQLLRRDDVLALDALYELRADDGAILTVQNRVLIDTRDTDPRRVPYSQLVVTAPEGPHAWLNRLVLVGSLHDLAPEPKVLIRVYCLT